MNAQFGQDVVGIGQHIHQMRNGCPLVARHIGHAGLQQGLGDRQYAFAVKLFAGTQLEFFDLRKE